MLIDQAKVGRAQLRGKVVVVTGAGRGIGREAARILARLGAATVLVELYAAQCDRMAQYIDKQESQARGWIRGPEALQAALRALRERKETSARLAALIEGLAGGLAEDVS